ncbi:MAG: hypothetical protein ACR2PK_04120 [Acidimicrobiales bacterium]
MQPPMRLAAQVLMVIVAVAMFLPWAKTDLGSLVGSSVSERSVSGFDVDEGVLAFVASLVTVVLIQAGIRPAWMGSGFAVAVLGRQLFDVLGEDLISPGIGLWVGTIAALAATVVLLIDMFGNVHRAAAAAVDEEP